MTDIIELKTAKYKGVEFLYEAMPTTGGNRILKFNYPGSDKQSVERQGMAPRSFNLTIIIPHDDYYAQRDALLRVLEDGQKGVLTHPTFGDIENVINGQWTLNESINELGRAKLTVPFEVDDATGVPRQSGALPARTATLANAVIAQATTDLANTYSVDINLSGNFSDAIANVLNVSEAFTQAAALAEPIADRIADFRSTLNTFTQQVGALVQAPANLAGNVNGLFEDLNTLFSAPETLLGSFQLLADFGADDPVTPPSTVARTERTANRDTLRANMRLQSLSYSYLNAAQVSFETTDSLDEAVALLETRYIDLRTNQAITDEALELLDRLRVQANATLDEARVNTRSIITIETPRKPLSVLVYEYYGNTELVDIIAEINNIKFNAFVSGEVRMLTG